MQSAVVSTRTHDGSAGDIASVRRFVDERDRELGYRPLSDQGWADLIHGPETTMLGARLLDEAGEITAYAQATMAPIDTSVPSDPSDPSDPSGGPHRPWTLETVFPRTGDIAAAGARLIATILLAVIDAGGTDVDWLVQDPTDVHESLATTFGLTVGRRLFQMRSPLPTGIEFSIETRPFDPARDIDDWVSVNARAFAWNPEQGSWTAANVRTRMDEPWFDPAGFLIHDRTDDSGTPRMAGFCWTKIHDTADPPLGEIYVIAVDPDFHGLGLGRALTLAGLQSLAARGIEMGMLFVDADNTAAVSLYDKLGFVVYRTDCLYAGRLGDGRGAGLTGGHDHEHD